MLEQRFASTLAASLLFSLALAAPAGAAPQGDASVPDPVREAMMHSRWDDAIGLLEELATSRADEADLWLYLSGIAHQRAERLEQALAVLRSLEQAHPESAWIEKSRFRRAEILTARGNFEPAEAIYEEAVRRLRSESRQDELAQIYIGFADEYSTEPVGRPDAGKLDCARAYTLYEKSLELGAARASREHALFRMAFCREQAGDQEGARVGYQNYLDAFDPARQKPLLASFEPGQKIWEARLALGRAELAAGRAVDARRTLEDLYSDLGKALEESAGELSAERQLELSNMAGDARFDVARTYVGGRDAALLAIAAYERFLAEFSGHTLGTRAAYSIAELSRSIGELSAAVEAFDAVTRRTPAAGAADEAAEEHARLVRQALFQKGATLQQQGSFPDAIAAYEEYTRRYATGAEWAQAQQGIVESSYFEGSAHRAEERFAQARSAWERFLAAHPLDGRVRQIQLDLGQLYIEEAAVQRRADSEADVTELLTAAIAQWETVLKKYPGSGEASHALFATGVLYETELGELTRAIATYRSCNFGPFAPQALARLEQMTQPSLALRTERTWRGDEAAQVEISIRNVEKVDVEVYALDLEAYFRKHLTHRQIEDLDLDLIAADAELEVAIEGYAEFAPLEQNIALPVEGPGVWAVAVTAGELRATTLVMRSDVDVIVKSSRREVFVFAEDMRAGAPATGVRVLVGLPNGSDSPTLKELETDADGIARLAFDELRSAGDVRVFAVRAGHCASDGLTLSGLSIATGLTPRVHVATDRSAYRPGDVVRWRAVVREVKDGSYAFEPGKKIQVDVLDSRGRPLSRKRIALSDFGTLADEVVLPAQAPLGGYSIQISGPGLPTSTGSFQVLQYELAKVELSFEQERMVYYRGEEVEVTAIAAYYYGEPVASSPLRYTLPDGRVLETKTDAQGRATLRFETRDFLVEGPLGFSALLTEENVAAQGSVYLATRGYRAALTTDRSLVLAGDSFQVTLHTTSPADEDVARTMTLKAMRRVPRPQGGYVEELELERELTTDEQTGKAFASLALAKGGTYILRAEGIDRFGNPVSAAHTLVVSGDDDSVKLRLLADTQRTKVGETLKLELVNRAGAGLALLTFEGETILGHRLVALTDGVNEVELPVAHEHFPNFAVSAAFMRGNEFFSAAANFDVTRQLTVNVTPKQSEIEPGGSIEVELSATDQLGRPVVAELALAVVDDSLFALYPDPTAPIVAFFEQGARRQAGLRTATSCTFSYAGRTQRIDQAILDEQTRLEAESTWEDARARVSIELAELGYAGEDQEGLARRPGPATPGPAGPPRSAATQQLAADTAADDFFLGKAEKSQRGRFGGRGVDARRKSKASEYFRAESKSTGAPVFDADTAFWTPAVVTDDTGKATVEFTLPDKSTRWRLTSRGVGTETLVGDGTATLVTRSQFFVELRAPAVLVEGDRPRFGARVHNLTGKSGRAKLSLAIAAADGMQTLPTTIELGEESVVEVLFPATGAISANDLTLTLSAEATLDGDAVAAETREGVVVRPWGLERRAGRSGRVTGSTTVFLELDAENVTNRRVELFVGPSLDRVLIDEALGQFGTTRGHRSYGASSYAKTAGDLIGVSAVLESLRGSGRATVPEYARLEARAQGLVASLSAAQNNDGGWPWLGVGRGSEPDPTSRVMIALAAARDVGVSSSEETWSRGASYLDKSFRRASQQEDERKAAILHALSAMDRGDFGAANRLHRNRSRLSPAALAHLTLALVEMERAPMATEVARVLEAAFEGAVDSPGPTPQALCSITGNKGWNRSSLDMTALAVLALERALPASPRVEQGVEYLLARRPWGDTRGAGVALAACARHQRETLRLTDAARVRVEVAGADPTVIEFEPGSPGRFFEVPLDGVSERRVRVSLTLEGRAEPHFSAVLAGFSTDIEKTDRSDQPFFFTRQDVVAEPPRYKGRVLPTGFEILRQRTETWTNTVSNLSAGDTTRVTLHYHRDIPRGETQEDMDYLVLEAPLPAGARVLEGSFNGGYGTYEMHDGALVVPLGLVRGGGSVTFTLIGADPGEYRVLPPLLRSAYEPERIAIGNHGDFNVLARGEASPDEYRPTPVELFHHGRLLYEDADFTAALAKLNQFYGSYEGNIRDPELTQAAKMLLFLSIDRRDAREIVRYFEVIKEKDPELFIPFEKVVSIGEAYRELREFERAMLVFRATVEETFGKDLKVAGTLEEQGERAGALDTLVKLVLEFPDSPTVVETSLAISDELLTLARVAHTEPSLRRAGRDRAALTRMGILRLKRFLAIHSANPLAPDAGLNLVSAYIDLENHETAAKLAGDMATIYKEPRYADAFLYTQAVAQWYLGQEQQAVELLQRIADAVYTDESTGAENHSENRDLALYILGQIYHARRDATTAAEYYERVEALFSDAREALAQFRAKSIALDEVTTARPGEAVELEVRYKNLTEAELLVYAVDLMTLTLREKNLSDVTAVNLAGISPTLRTTVTLGKGSDLREQTATAALSLADPGAYLVICRGDALHTSGLVLVSDLELDVIEDRQSGRLRVQALDAGDGTYVRDVDVRVIGSANSAFTSGETDPRGLFVADGVQGAPTVIARHDGRNYAFYRGVEALTLLERDNVQQELIMGQQLDSDEYFKNVIQMNREQRGARALRLQDEIQRERRGVQVYKVK